MCPPQKKITWGWVRLEFQFFLEMAFREAIKNYLADEPDILWGKKCMAIFQTHNWKSQVFFQHACHPVTRVPRTWTEF